MNLNDLYEGAVDDLEARRIEDLEAKMDDLVARAKQSNDPKVKEALRHEFARAKAERDSYYKLNVEEELADTNYTYTVYIDGTKEGTYGSKEEAKAVVNRKKEQAPGRDYRIKPKARTSAASIRRFQKNRDREIEEHGGGVNNAGSYVAWRRKANKERGITKQQPVGKPAVEEWLNTAPGEPEQDELIKVEGYASSIAKPDMFPLDKEKQWKIKIRQLVADYIKNPQGLYNIAKRRGPNSPEAYAYNQILHPTGKLQMPPNAITFEGWSNKMVAQRTGTAPTPYSVYIKGKEWKSFADDDHAENVANKLRAKFKQEGKDPSVITIAPTGYDKGMDEGATAPIIVPKRKAKEKQPKKFHIPYTADDYVPPAVALARDEELNRKFNSPEQLKKDADYRAYRAGVRQSRKEQPKPLPTKDVEEGWKQKAAALALSGAMAGASGITLNPNRIIDGQGRSAANPYGNVDSQGNPIKKPEAKPADKAAPVTDKEKSKKDVKEDIGGWIVFDPVTKQIKKRFKTHTAGKSYAQAHGLGFASSEYYFDNVKEKDVSEAYSKNPPNLEILRDLAQQWQDGSDEAYDAINQLGWNIADDRKGVYIIKQSDMSGRSKIYFPELTDEASMAWASHKPTGPKFGGYLKGTDPAPTEFSKKSFGAESKEMDEGIAGNMTVRSNPLTQPLRKRNYVAKNAQLSGAGKHNNNLKAAAARGKAKHKGQAFELDEMTNDDIAKIRKDAEAGIKSSLDKQSDARISALKNPPKEKSFMQKVGDKQIGMVKGAWKGLTGKLEESDNFLTWAVRNGYNISKPEIYESAKKEFKALVEDCGPIAPHETYYGAMDEAKKVGTRVQIVKGSEAGKTGTIGEIRPGSYKGAPGYYTVDLDNGGHVQLRKEALRVLGINESLKDNEYYVWTVYFDDGSSKRIKVKSDEFDPYEYYAKQNKVVVNVDYSWDIHQ